ncbi:MAG: pseudouridine synthase [Minisyncoccales bacterium]
MSTIKISKFLSEAGVASRRKSETLITQGLIFVNGKKMANVARRIDPAKDKIEFNGKPVQIQNLAYYLLNKPVGYTSTTEDAHARKLITELVPGFPKVWPVGRLDKYTSGLILLTNDGQMTLKLTHPRYRVEKEYEITTGKPLGETEIKFIQRGIKLEDGFIKPDRFEKTGDNSYRIVIHSGKKHVVRRLIEKTGNSVAQLKRTRIGFLTLDGLQTGKWRPLTQREIEKLTE